MSESETLRRAAALMRERADAARSYNSKTGQEVPWFSQADLYDFDEDDGPHIIGMSPAVAIDMANLLDSVDRAARLSGSAANLPEALSIRSKALAVARTYLGEYA